VSSWEKECIAEKQREKKKNKEYLRTIDVEISRRHWRTVENSKEQQRAWCGEIQRAVKNCGEQ
jgi:hypothetical protein